MLPDYQGIGLSKYLLDFVGEFVTIANNKLMITTSQPSLNFILKKSSKWRLQRFGRVSKRGKTGSIKVHSSTRITTSWIYCK